MKTWFVMRVYHSNEFAKSPEVAVVMMDESCAKTLLERMDLAEELKKKNNSFYTLEYWSRAYMWCDFEMEIPYDAPHKLRALPEWTVSNIRHPGRETMSVTGNEIWWMAHERYSNNIMETDCITREELEAI